MKMLLRTLTLILALGTFSVNPARAQDDDRWNFAGTLYLWGAGIDGSTSIGSDISVSFSEILDNFNFGLMGALEANRGKWLIVADAVYLDVSKGETSSRPVLPTLPSGGFTIDSAAKVGVKGTVFQLMGGYELVRSPTFKLHGTFGARYLKLSTDLGIDISTSLGGGRSFESSVSGSNWDGVIGLRGRAAINEKWFVPFYADVGAGDSRSTWQAFGGVGYDFGRSDLIVGYRHLAWDFKDNNFISDIAFSGPAIAFTYRF